MPVSLDDAQLDYLQVRALARRLRERTGRDVKHTDILADIATVVGTKPAAMMHRLKGESRSRGPRLDVVSHGWPSPAVGYAAIRGIRPCGAENGREFQILLMSRETDDWATLSVRVAHRDTGTAADDTTHAEKAWSTSVVYQAAELPSPLETIVTDPVTLAEAVDAAFVQAECRVDTWRRLCARPFTVDMSTLDRLAYLELRYRLAKKDPAMNPELCLQMAAKAGFGPCRTASSREQAFSKLLKGDETNPGSGRLFVIVRNGDVNLGGPAPADKVWEVGVWHDGTVHPSRPLRRSEGKLSLDAALARASAFNDVVGEFWAEGESGTFPFGP